MLQLRPDAQNASNNKGIKLIKITANLFLRGECIGLRAGRTCIPNPVIVGRLCP